MGEEETSVFPLAMHRRLLSEVTLGQCLFGSMCYSLFVYMLPSGSRGQQQWCMRGLSQHTLQSKEFRCAPAWHAWQDTMQKDESEHCPTPLPGVTCQFHRSRTECFKCFQAQAGEEEPDWEDSEGKEEEKEIKSKHFPQCFIVRPLSKILKRNTTCVVLHTHTRF